MKLPQFIIRVVLTFYENAFYILWTLLLPIVLYNLNIGQDLLHIMFDEYPFTKWGVNWNWVLISLLYTIMIYNIWVVPTWLIMIWSKLTKQDPIYLFEKFVTHLNQGPTISIKYFSVLPILLFGVNCFSQSKPLKFSLCLLVVALVMFLSFSARKKIQPAILSYFQWAIHKLQSLFKRFGIQSAAAQFNVVNVSSQLFWHLLIGFIFQHISTLYLKEEIMGILMIANGVWHLHCMAIIEQGRFNSLQPAKAKITQHQLLRDSFVVTRLNYTMLGICSIALVALFFYMSSERIIYKLSAMLVGMGILNFYLFLFDLIYKSNLILFQLKTTHQTAHPTGYLAGKVILHTLAIVFLMYLIGYNFNKHPIYVAEKKDLPKLAQPNNQPIDTRPDFTTYMDQWLAQHPNDSTVLLITGQGGGNRGGAWITLGLNALNQDSILHHTIAKHTLAFSTVSGSTMGANMTLALWHTQKTYPEFPFSYREFATALFNRNYLSNALFGLMMKDELMALLGHPAKDRNYQLQMDETNAFETALPANIPKSKASSYLHQDVVHNLNSDILSPIFLINTCITQNGNRGLVSPIKPSFTPAEDVYLAYKKSFVQDQRYQNYPYRQIAAVTHSQSFPFITAYNSLDSLGNLVDGGLYDNSGSQTMQEFYLALKHYLYTKNVQRRIIILRYNNSVISSKIAEPNLHKGTLLHSIDALWQSPFSSHQVYMHDQLKQTVERLRADACKPSMQDTVIDITLETSFALNKVLPRSVIDSMANISERVQQPVLHFLRQALH